MNPYSRMEQHLRRVLDYAFSEARLMNHYHVGTEHILLGIIREGQSLAAQALHEEGVTLQFMRLRIQEHVGKGMQIGAVDGYTPRASRCLEEAEGKANISERPFGAELLLRCILDDTDAVATRVLDESGFSISRLKNHLDDALLRSQGESNKRAFGFGRTADPVHHARPEERGFDSDPSAPQEDVFKKYGVDLCDMAKQGKIDPVVCREDELVRMMQILCRRTKNNPCLVGEPGVGKTALVEGLALRINEGLVPKALKDKRIFALSLSQLLAGAKFRGEFEERLMKLLSDIQSKDHGEVVLFIDEIHTLIGTGSASGSLDASNMLKPYLARGEIQIIGATTHGEYRKHIEKDPALERRFQPVIVNEPGEMDTLEILKALRPKYEQHHGVTLDDEVLKEAIELSKRHIHDRFLPDKAIDIIDEASAGRKLTNPEKSKVLHEVEEQLKAARQMKERAVKTFNFELAAEARDEERECLERLDAISHEVVENDIAAVSSEDLAAVISRWTGIPVTRLMSTERNHLLDMEKRLGERIFGQEAAIGTVCKSIRRMRSVMGNPEKPAGSFLLIGSSGVGKTAFAKALTEVLFDDGNKLIRFDMSEFTERHSIARLIGSPPGYVGYDQGGQLTERVRLNPYSVILFDEIDKAHEDVTNLLIQILDEGHLSDAQGRKVHFKNVLVLMTMTTRKDGLSKAPMGFGESGHHSEEARRIRMREDLKRHLSPLFLNRIDEVVIFEDLNETVAARIARSHLERLKKRIAPAGVSLSWDDAVSESLGTWGYDVEYGARPLERMVTKMVEDEITQAWIEGKIESGGTVHLKVENDRIVFKHSEW